MAEQALQNSVDPEEIKKFRKTTRTQVTTSVNRLGNLLAKKDGEDFDHKVINGTEVEQVETMLKEKFNMFLKLHEKYCHLRAEGKDDAEESELEGKDAAYSEEVTTKVYLLMDQLKSYHKSLAKRDAKLAAEEAGEEARQAKVKSIPMHEQNFEDSVMN